MDELDRDTLIRIAAFEHVRRLDEVYDHLKQLNSGTLHLPARPKDHPDRDRFAMRFERFPYGSLSGCDPLSVS